MVNSIYTVIIRGGTNPPNRISGTSCDGVYRVDWYRVLPNFENPQHHKWRLTATFNTELCNAYTEDEDTLVFIECDAFSRQGIFDTLNNSSSSVVCIANLHTLFYQKDEVAVISFHKTNNVIPLTVQFPTQDTFSVKLTGFNGEPLDDAKYTSWVLTLQLEKVFTLEN